MLLLLGVRDTFSAAYYMHVLKRMEDDAGGEATELVVRVIRYSQQMSRLRVRDGGERGGGVCMIPDADIVMTVATDLVVNDGESRWGQNLVFISGDVCV